MQARHPLDDVQMSRHDRARAKAEMERAERTIETMVRIYSAAQSVTMLIKRQTLAVIHRINGLRLSAQRQA